ncbi:hypothetical protein ACFE04_028218 [Oxalis oulophora]
MGLLDQLWDDTVAGPRPDYGLGKLRKHSSLPSTNSSGKELISGGGSVRSFGDEATEEGMRVTRRIMIIKPPGYTSSPPVSPAGSTPPVSPFSGIRELHRFRRKSTSDTFEKASETGPRSAPPPYDV